ncbi:hypothetical protein ACX3U9_03205 [Corynebacterium pyruviciproducens]|uniref:hypothetical protein n=1 Tax=Corynebacterium pyruviciproducens TaxID=598660 RepID=UPI0023F2D6CB|nr:hypothetical protein [Corynebacterium pyruviciproducens]MDK7214888.1 hypothetical protein [Corynebacterium pyruviciproducens]
MKNRLVASGVAVSVALAGGVVAAPAASATAWTDVFNTCVSGFKAIDAAAKQQNLSPEQYKTIWEATKAQSGVAGSSVPGDAFSICMESALKDVDKPAIAGPAVGILLAIIVGALGLAGGAAWFLDQQGIVDLPL